MSYSPCALRLAEHGHAKRTVPAGISRARTRGRAKGGARVNAKRGEIKTTATLVENSLRRCGSGGTGPIRSAPPQKRLRPRTRRCAYIRRHQLDRGRTSNGAFRLQHHCSAKRMNATKVPQGVKKTPSAGPACPAPGHSAGATARVRSLSTPLTSTAITAVATTKPSAITAVVPSTKPKPPRPCRKAMAPTAAPDTTKVRK